MKTLKEYVEMQGLTKETDLQIIYRWFTENGLEKEGLELIPKLAESQMTKIQDTLTFARSWIPTMIDMTEFYDRKTGQFLNIIQQYCMLDMDLDGSFVMEWAKTEIPKMELPKIFFQPTIKYLAKYGIKFKDKSNE